MRDTSTGDARRNKRVASRPAELALPGRPANAGPVPSRPEPAVRLVLAAHAHRQPASGLCLQRVGSPLPRTRYPGHRARRRPGTRRTAQAPPPPAPGGREVGWPVRRRVARRRRQGATATRTARRPRPPGCTGCCASPTRTYLPYGWPQAAACHPVAASCLAPVRLARKGRAWAPRLAGSRSPVAAGRGLAPGGRGRPPGPPPPAPRAGLPGPAAAEAAGGRGRRDLPRALAEASVPEA